MSRGWHVPPVAPEDRLYTAGEAAKRLQITVKTLTRQADAGSSPTRARWATAKAKATADTAPQ